MGFSSNTGMSFRTRLPSNSPRAGIQCLATRSRSKHERNVTQQPFSLHSQGFYERPAQTRDRSLSRTRTLAPQASLRSTSKMPGRYAQHSLESLAERGVGVVADSPRHVDQLPVTFL